MNSTQHLLEVLATDSGVDPSYRHFRKQVSALDPVLQSGRVLKWYNVCPIDLPIPDAISDLARAHIAAVELEARGFGFVILHRCGTSFYFLIVSTWRGSNEVWETVFYKDGEAMKEFALFSRDGAHKPTFCVWELVPVGHETKAWERFLSSARDEPAIQAWFEDCFEGPA